MPFDDAQKVPPQVRLFWEEFYCPSCLCMTAFLRNRRIAATEVVDGKRSATVETRLRLASSSSINHGETFEIAVEFQYCFAEALLREVHETQ